MAQLTSYALTANHANSRGLTLQIQPAMHVIAFAVGLIIAGGCALAACPPVVFTQNVIGTPNFAEPLNSNPGSPSDIPNPGSPQPSQLVFQVDGRDDVWTLPLPPTPDPVNCQPATAVRTVQAHKIETLAATNQMIKAMNAAWGTSIPLTTMQFDVSSATISGPIGDLNVIFNPGSPTQ